MNRQGHLLASVISLRKFQHQIPYLVGHAASVVAKMKQLQCVCQFKQPNVKRGQQLATFTGSAASFLLSLPVQFLRRRTFSTQSRINNSKTNLIWTCWVGNTHRHTHSGTHTFGPSLWSERSAKSAESLSSANCCQTTPTKNHTQDHTHGHTHTHTPSKRQRTHSHTKWRTQDLGKEKKELCFYGHAALWLC